MNDFKNKTVIVTGGTGSIGSEIVRQLLTTKVAQVRIFSRDEHKQFELRHELGENTRVRYLIGDVRDRDRLEFAFRGVDICFHAAALKHVPICEYNPFEALNTNAVGTQNVIDMSIKHNLEKVVAISTDKAVVPESVLGASKLMMERLVIAANFSRGMSRTVFICVRFGNVLNSRGSVIHLWRKQIEAGGPVTVTDRLATRFFMEIPQAVQLVFDAAHLAQGGEIFVLKMERRPILEFAEETIRQHGRGKRVEIVFIGMRPGEKLREILLTTEEFSHAIETKEMLIVLPLHLGAVTKKAVEHAYPGAKKATSTEYTL